MITLICLLLLVGAAGGSAAALRRLCKPDCQPVLGDLKSLYDRHTAARDGFTVFRL